MPRCHDNVIKKDDNVIKKDDNDNKMTCVYSWYTYIDRYKVMRHNKKIITLTKSTVIYSLCRQSMIV